VKTLGALEARYTDDHVPLALILGAIGALSTVRRLLPDEPVPPAGPQSERADSRASPEAFMALLLGAVATYDRLLGLFGLPPAEHAAATEAEAGGEPWHRLEGLLR
jgi:hypothetical protein